MSKRIICSLIVLILLFTIPGCRIKSNEKNIDSIDEMINSVKVIINGKEYVLVLEDNETTKKFVDMLPQELNMSELNGNEKYVYFNESLPTNSINPEYINVGDVMLFGDNCLVIFYKSFETTYNYTKIGHINNLPDLEATSIIVRFEK